MKRQKPNLVIFALCATNCRVKVERLIWPGAEVSWKGTPWRVIAPFMFLRLMLYVDITPSRVVWECSTIRMKMLVATE